MFRTFYIFFLLLTVINTGISEFVKCIADCVELSECYEAKMFLKENKTIPQICGFKGIEPMVCCAELDEKTLFNIYYARLRKADKKCKEIHPPNIPRRNKPQGGSGHGALGGFPAGDEFHYMTALGYGDVKNPVYRCGGFLVDKNVVITAAHCTKLNGEPPTVARIGSYSLSSNKTEAIRIVKIIPYPSYKDNSYLDDIAIIFLAENSTEKPACLLRQRLNLRYDNRTIAVGFGTTTFAGRFSTILIKVYLNIINNEICEKEYKDQEIIHSQLCALEERRTFENGTSLVQDTCQGDSGGPLVLDRNHNYIVGIVSYGRGCGSETPGVYTYIDSYLDWIDAVVREEGNINGLYYCEKLEPPYLTIRTCNKGTQGQSCTSIANVGENHNANFKFAYSMVTLGYGDVKNPEYKCDGVLIDQNIVLTAAQCARINGNPPIIAKLGREIFSNEIKIRIVNVIQHPNFNETTYLNDIAIVFLAEKLEMNYQPACLFSATFFLKFENQSFALSYGTTDFDGPLTMDLIQVQINIVDKKVCEKNYQSELISNSQFCALTKTEYVGEDTHLGNSGGPIYNLDYIIGIVSYGQGRAIYTNITAYLDWIEAVVWPEGTQEDRHFVA